MTIDRKTLDPQTIVELEDGAWHGPACELDDSDENVTRVFVPVPDGVTVEDAEKALAALEPADPDADLIERMAEAIYAYDDAALDLAWHRTAADGNFRKDARRCARAALAVVREADAR